MIIDGNLDLISSRISRKICIFADKKHKGIKL